MLTEKSPKNPKFYCEKCEYITCNKKDFTKHKMTAKHLKWDLCNEFEQNVTEKSPKIPTSFSCKKCEKVYKSRTGLWHHNRKCTFIENIKNKNNEICILTDTAIQVKHEKTEENILNALNDKNFILEILQQNKDFKDLLVEQNKIMMEMCKNSTNLTNNSYNTMTNSNNKAFNLNFFLNETCKNAMNITDFVDSLQLQLSDLESVGRLGFVDGLSNIIIKNLKAMDETERPIHCTDKKRETVYVRDNNKWEKDETLAKLRKAIKYVAHKNTKLIPQWKAKYPDYMDSTSVQSDQYNNLVIEVLGGEDASNVNEDKIMRKIAREVVIEK